MCIDLPWAASDVGLTFGQLANVQTVGIGLYLALGVIQAVSTSGVAGLSRRVNTMLSAVSARRMRNEVANVRRLSGEVSGLEIGFHKLNRCLLTVTFVLFVISVVYFVYCQLNQDLNAQMDGLWFIFGFYLALPITIFAVTSVIIWVRCRAVAGQVEEAEKRVRRALLNL